MINILFDYLREQNIDGIFISKLQNVRYLSQYTGDDSYLFITEKGNYFITDPRYTEQAEQECPGFIIYNWREIGKTIPETLKKIIEGMNIKRFAFEGDYVDYNTYSELIKINSEAVPITGVIEELRSIKTHEEIHNLRVACQIADRAFERILRDIRIGVTEKELASKLSHYMVIEGSDTKPYGNILISGKRTSLLHGIPSNKAIEYGDFVLMDYGCSYKGYLSDMTRTVIVGKATAKQREVYNLENRMLEDSKKVMAAGVSAKKVYNASIEVIKDTEYYNYHYSGIGHGIGLYVHEIPFMSPKSNDILKENNVVTIEPGIYIPGWGGVRIEDQILVLKDGNESLTNSPRDLIEL
ncbi:Xaa-Pro peptidase family protein [Sedimentibacter sp.]|uniref:M24 family metallopeptidase n=1 Tax=Sedimentibacter sp. TaxID=1960295 RepID=UPI0028B0381C|nr:Xaa-Pro peptidase family protein [Sedimentibacter sp.]